MPGALCDTGPVVLTMRVSPGADATGLQGPALGISVNNAALPVPTTVAIEELPRLFSVTVKPTAVRAVTHSVPVERPSGVIKTRYGARASTVQAKSIASATCARPTTSCASPTSSIVADVVSTPRVTTVVRRAMSGEPFCVIVPATMKLPDVSSDITSFVPFVAFASGPPAMERRRKAVPSPATRDIRRSRGRIAVVSLNGRKADRRRGVIGLSVDAGATLRVAFHSVSVRRGAVDARFVAKCRTTSTRTDLKASGIEIAASANDTISST